MLMVAAGGRKYVLRFSGRGLRMEAAASDVSNGAQSNPNLHLVYWSQWENYALAGDGNGNTWIWDGNANAFTSPGFNNVDKEASRVPNGGTVMAYAHGRGCIVVNSRALLTGDLLNSTNLKSAEDVLAFREQVYWATGQYFSPPSQMGAITASAILPIRDTAHGHGELMLHCEHGIFSVDLNVFPRSDWSKTPMVKTAYSGGGACGPYAVALFDGDQLFRSQVGVQTLRSARAESGRLGNPQRPISEPVAPLFASDSSRWLRFASLASWESARKALVTCYPIVRGAHRWHRGIAAMNFAPVPNKQSDMAWEGLWTMPPQAAGIIQLLSARIDGENRMFALCRGDDGRNRLVEFRSDIDADILEGGVKQRVRCQILARTQDMDLPHNGKQVQRGTLFLSGVIGRMDWRVSFRRNGETKWTLWRSGYVNNAPSCDCEGVAIQDTQPWEGEIKIGEMPPAPGAARTVQFLIQFAGVACLESFRVSWDKDDSKQDVFDARGLAVEAFSRKETGAISFEDYEYSETSEAESWLGQIAKK